MVQDWTSGLIGGLLIGSASALLLLGNGRIAGISGILGRFLAGDRMAESGAFLAGLVLAPLALAAVGHAPEIAVTHSIPMLAAGGLLVGIGTRMGNGCTSGHGVCGLSRLSQRSMLATATFMTTAAVVVFILRHIIGGL